MKKYLEQLVRDLLVVIEKHKKILSIFLIFLIIIVLIIIIFNYRGKKMLELEKNTDVTNAIHAIVINDNVLFHKKPKESIFSKISTLKRGENAYVLEEHCDKDNIKWYKIKCNDRVGYVLKENIDYYKKSNEEYVLMSDVSKFNVIYKHFETTSDYQLFLVKNNFQYVYIRAGGRGYGEEGKFYTDPDFKMFIDACEYLKIPYGFYYIDEAINSEEIDEEIAFMKDFINKNSTEMNKLPLAIDIETHDGDGRADEMWEDRVYLAEELIQKFRLNGIDTIIYSNAKTANEYLSNASANFWLAYYPQENEIPKYWYSETDQEPTENIEFMNKMIGWQFSETGVSNQIKEKVDVNLVKNSFFKQFLQKD